jgi:ribosomal protein L31E
MDTIMIVVKPSKDLPLEFLTMSLKNKNIDMINMIRQFEKGLQKDTERWIMTEGNERLGNRGIKKLEARSKTSGQNKYGTL